MKKETQTSRQASDATAGRVGVRSVLAIDPGNEASGYVVFDGERVIDCASECDNERLLALVAYNTWGVSHVAIEMVASYGMAVGETTFDTVLWIGRFIEAAKPLRHTLVYRKRSGDVPGVCMHLCHDNRAKDSNIAQALRDRFPKTGGGSKPSVGTKAKPGPLYGVSKHAWQALGVAVTWWDSQNFTA